MSRLAPLDKALVLILVPLWLAVFIFGVRTQVRGVGLAAIALSVADADSYPVLTGDYAEVFYRSDPLDDAGLEAGDRLIRLGDADLRGVGTRDLFALGVEQKRGLDVPLVFERGNERRETHLAMAPVSVFASLVAVSFAFAVSAIFLTLRGTPTPAVRAYFHFAMCAAIGPCIALGSRLEVYAGLTFFVAGNLFYHPMMLRLAYLFPDSRMPEGPRHRISPWFFGILFSTATFFMFTRWMGMAKFAFTAITVLVAAAVLRISFRKYRQVGRVGRRQMKWIVAGTYCALLPGALLISVVRFNLFDVDRILSATASYNILLVLLGAGALVVVPRVAEALSGVAGVDPATGQVVLSLLLAAAVIPAHRQLRGRRAIAFACARQEGLELFTDDRVERALLGSVPLVRGCRARGEEARVRGGAGCDLGSHTR